MSTHVFFNHMLHASGIDHITLTVKDLKRSEPFYDTLMLHLGLKKEFSEYGFAGWTNKNFHFYISEAEAPYKNDAYSKYRAGLNHISFKSESREDVDSLYEFLQKHEIKIVHAPKYLKQYGHGEYFVAMEDPDGIKVEFGYWFNDTDKEVQRPIVREYSSVLA